MDFGIVGNCQYSALIDRRGAVVWMCWPRFDSSFVFGSLLDASKGGLFSINAADDSEMGKQSYLPNTNILRTAFHSAQGDFEVIDFAPRFKVGRKSFRPTMLIRMVRPISGEPLARVRCVPTYDYGRAPLDRRLLSDRILFSSQDIKFSLHTDMPLNLIAEDKPFVLSKNHYMVFCMGSDELPNLKQTCESYLENTKDYWETWVKHCHLPADYQAEVIRSALVLKLHQFEDTGAIIAATTTSIPEAKGTERTWDYRYCWLRDAHFALNAFRKLGHFEEIEGFVNYLRTVVESADQIIQPVYGLTGEPKLKEEILTHLEGYQGKHCVRIGNQAHEHIQHDVYGELILAIAPLFLDLRFVANVMEPPRSMLLNLLLQIKRYMHAEDAGLWEFRNRSRIHTFSLLMHWAGSAKGAQIAEKYQYLEMIPLAQELEKEAREAIEKQAWNEELGFYVQARGSTDYDASMLLLINLGFIPTDHPHTKRHIEKLAEGLLTHNSLIRRYAHLDDFGSTENAFTVCSFWLAEAMGRIDQTAGGRLLFEKLLGCSNHLGLFSEDIDPVSLEQWGNFPQVYSHVGLILAAFQLSQPWD